MSLISAREFIEKITSNKEFEEKMSNSTDAVELTNAAKTEGFDFTIEELKLVLEDIYSGELSDDDLSNVVGGSSNETPPKPNPPGVLISLLN